MVKGNSYMKKKEEKNLMNIEDIKKIASNQISQMKMDVRPRYIEKKGETLLEKAKKISLAKNSRFPMTQEEIEVALAWANDEITMRQVRGVTGTSFTSSYAWLATRLKKYIQLSENKWITRQK